MNRVRKAAARRFVGVRGLRALGLSLPAAGGLLLAAPAGQAMQLYDGSTTGANNWEVSLDTTLSYNGMYRVGSPSATLVSGILNTNGNDGDANFRHGLVTNLFEVLPVLDIKNNDFGMHFSGEYFINTVYLQGNQNNQPADTLNSYTSSTTSFARSTRQAEGNNGRMLDAFVYNSWHFGNDQEFTVKAGKQTLFWGQSLFFNDGIAIGQAPVDAISAQNIINAQNQQIYLPVGQVVVTYKPDLTYTLQAYYQFEWEPDALQGVGGFFSGSDVTGPGADLLYLSPGFGIPRVKSITPPSQNGQFGASVQAQYGNYDVGLFALRYDSKAPAAVPLSLNLANVPGLGVIPTGGNFRWLYPRDIYVFGTSLGTTVGATQIGAELSLHTHTPLVGVAGTATNFEGVPLTSYGDANGNPSYPVGNVLVGLVNFIYGSPSLPFDPGGITAVGEMCYTNTFRVTANKANLQPGRTNQSLSFGATMIPTYNEVLPFLQLTFPVGLIGYTIAGNSEFDSTLNHGAATEFDVGVAATYRSVWTASLTYVAPFGNVSTNPTLPNSGSGTVDRKYIQLNIQRTF
jgi:hypothetical protein